MVTELERLHAQIRACRVCRDQPTGDRLPHDPRPVVTPSASARILIAGQAPGTKVHETGVPFNDRSGDRLRDWLGVSRETFYDPAHFAIVPMGFCFPGQDRKGGDLPPRRECAPAWRSQLLALMPRIELILAIGIYAQSWHMGTQKGRTLTQAVADWRSCLEPTTSPRILALPHPSWRNTAWLKRNPWFEAALLPRLRREIALYIPLGE